MRQAFSHGLAATTANVYGILSLVAWSLLLIVSVKYLVIVLRADNDGEGGILALMPLVHGDASKRTASALILLIGLLGAALLYGDSMITPAIRVLSAVEGVRLAAPALHGLVVPITTGILLALFAVQRHGTRSVGRFFGPSRSPGSPLPASREAHAVGGCLGSAGALPMTVPQSNEG